MTNVPPPAPRRTPPILGELDVDVLIQLPGFDPKKVGRLRLPIFVRGNDEFVIHFNEQMYILEKAARDALAQFPPEDDEPAAPAPGPKLPPVMTAAEIVEAEPGTF